MAAFAAIFFFFVKNGDLMQKNNKMYIHFS